MVGEVCFVVFFCLWLGVGKLCEEVFDFWDGYEVIDVGKDFECLNFDVECRCGMKGFGSLVKFIDFFNWDGIGYIMFVWWSKGNFLRYLL